MDNTAIEQIEKNAAAVAAQEVLKALTLNRAVVLPEGYTIESLEKLSATRDRFRGNYSTFHQGDFVVYCVDHDHKAEVVFIDGEQFTAKAFFDLGTKAKPGHAKHRALLALKPTAAYTALYDGPRAFADRSLSQEEAAEILEDWSDFFEAYDSDAALVAMPQAITAVRNCTVESFSSATHRKENLSAECSLLEKIGAKSEHSLPANLYFSCAPHLNTLVRRFRLRVSVTPKAGELVFKFRLADIGEQIEIMASDFAANIRASLETETRVYVGEFTS